MEYRGMSEQEVYHKGYLDGQAAMGDLLKSAPIKGPTYKLSESNSIDVLTQINKSQAKEIEGLREWKDKAIKLIEPSIEQSKGVLEDCDSEYWSDRANKIIDEGKNLLSQDTTQPDKGGE